MMTGLSVAFAFKCGNFNIGTTGQYTVGGFVALFLANTLYQTVPDSLLWIICLIAAGLAGAIWALIPGILKAYRNVNIVISVSCLTILVCILLLRVFKAFIYDSAGARSQTSKIAVPKGIKSYFPRLRC